MRATFVERASSVVEMVARKAYWTGVTIARIFVARYRLRLHRTRAITEAAGLQTPVCLVHTWVDERAYDPASGQFWDQDFGEVRRYLESTGRRVLTVPNILPAASYRRVLRFVAGAPDRYLVPNALLSFWDVLAVVLGTTVRVPRRSRFPPLAGIEISDLLYEDAWNEWVSERAAANLLMGRWVASWKRAGLLIERFIYTFENHSWERVVCAAFRRFYPGTRLIAHQPNGISLLLMNYFISTEERDVVPLPDVIITNGGYASKLLKGSGYDPERVVCGGGLRQRYLQEWLDEDQSARRGTREIPRIIVAPSIGYSESVELLRKAIVAFAAARDLSVILKCHPSMPFELVVSALGVPVLPRHIVVSKEPLKILLKDADVLVYNSSAFPSVEALAAGVPVVHVQPEFALDLDPLDCCPGLGLDATSPEEILACVRRHLSDEAVIVGEARERSRRMLRELIGKVDERTYELFAR
jgi:glycosyltransferase involved in cell wall biosynthesis